jgi:hypothetical protein
VGLHEMNIPTTVYEDVRTAVEIAIAYGVSADDFLSAVRIAWKEELSDKARVDDDVFQRDTSGAPK